MTPRSDRRNAAAHEAILEAAWDLSIEVGYARLTVEAIAKRAGVGKQTIYRWWPSKEAVLLEALDISTDGTMTFPDTGDITADLAHQVAQVARLMASEEYAPYRGLIAAAQSDPDLSQQIRRIIVEPRVDAAVERIEKAQRDGQVRNDIAPVDIVEFVYAPIYYRLLLHTRPLRAADARKQVRLAFEGLAPAE